MLHAWSVSLYKNLAKNAKLMTFSRLSRHLDWKIRRLSCDRNCREKTPKLSNNITGFRKRSPPALLSGQIGAGTGPVDERRNKWHVKAIWWVWSLRGNGSFFSSSDDLTLAASTPIKRKLECLCILSSWLLWKYMWGY